MNDKVSIITPVYNSSKYLAQTVQSVLAQTYQNWELILVDDGSKDGSWELMKEWEAKDTRIKCFNHPGRVNKGVSATRNLGLSLANGNLIALLDSDDLWLPDKLQKQVQVFNNNPNVGYIYGIADVIDEHGAPYSGSDFPSSFGNAPYSGINSNLFKENLNLGISIPCLTVMATKAIMEEAGRFYVRFKLLVEDHFLFTVISYRHPVYFMEEVIAQYRLHSDSYTYKNDWMFSFFEYYKELYAFVQTEDHGTINAARLSFTLRYIKHQPLIKAVKTLNYLYKAGLITGSIFFKAFVSRIRYSGVNEL